MERKKNKIDFAHNIDLDFKLFDHFIWKFSFEFAAKIYDV